MRRAPVQRSDRKGGPSAGTIAWEEHLEVYEAYAKKYGRSQSAERIAERAGFGYDEIVLFTGAPPKTWLPIIPKEQIVYGKWLGPDQNICYPDKKTTLTVHPGEWHLVAEDSHGSPVGFHGPATCIQDARRKAMSAYFEYRELIAVCEKTDTMKPHPCESWLEPELYLLPSEHD